MFLGLKDTLVMKLFCVVRGESRSKCALAKLFGSARLLSALILFALAAATASAQVNVLTYHNDIARTGQNTKRRRFVII